MKTDVFNMQGEKVSTATLNDAIFGITPNEAVVHQVVVAYLANQRQGTQSAKTRSEVSGGGRKPWRQKGTGRARVGSSRNPVWVGGGVAFAPKPRDYDKAVNKKMRRLALKSVLSSKVLEKELCVVNELKFDEPKTKEMVKVLENLKLGKTLIVIDENDRNVVKSVSNIKDSSVSLVGTLNVYELLKYDNLLLTEASLAKLTEVYA